MMPKHHVLAIDNYDSFVHNLADELRQHDARVDVYRSHWPIEDALAYIDMEHPDLLLLSPGPGRPEEATLCLSLLEQAPENLPIFGVCLGHQCMIQHFGGRVERCNEVVHGKPALVTHHGTELFEGLPNPIQVGRYHSLIGVEIPETLVIEAECNGQVMAVRHKTRPIWGVQFHPESILTPNGVEIVENVLNIAKERRDAA